MLHLPPLPLKPSLQRYLAQAQAQINALPDYRTQVKAAKTTWQSKKKQKAQRRAFERNERALQEASPYCHYCEAVPGVAIDHIYPRGFFPELTFVWDNYTWSCFTCNTTYKGAQCRLFKTKTSTASFNLVKNYRFEHPPHTDALLLNPRCDDPLDYWTLDLETAHWHIKAPKGSRAYERAAYTLDLLQLNHRPRLVASRQQAILDYWALLEQYQSLLSEPTPEQIHAQLPHKSPRFYQRPLLEQASLAALALQRRLLSLPHPSVWRSLQREAPERFAAVPMALFW